MPQKNHPVVAIQGELGAFSHQAALELLGPQIDILPRPTFEELFAAVSAGDAHRGIIPIENSLAGSIHENYDRLQAGSLFIVGETQLRIRHCLIGCPDADLDGVTRVLSHPAALAQCRGFFAARRGIEAVATYDTAGAVVDVLRARIAAHAAIASKLAAGLYGGRLLMENLEDDPQNFTRFLVLARDAGPVEESNKTSLVFTLENIPGALHRALGAFALRGVDLAKIESRPIRGRPWEYAFYLDALGDPRGAVGEAIEDLRSMARELRVFGCYPDGLRRERLEPTAD